MFAMFSLTIRSHILKALLLVLAFMPAALADAKASATKILERSEKKVPAWYSSPGNGFIFAEGEAATLAEAQEEAVRQLVLQVVQSVGVNVEHSSYMSASSGVDDGELHEKEMFESSTEIAYARLPFVKGISLAEAQATYWEKLMDKSSGKTFYKFAVLYPLSERRVAEMRTQYEREDNEKSASLKECRRMLSEVSSSEQIEGAVRTLTSLREFFLDTARQHEAQELCESYRLLYKDVRMEFGIPADGKVAMRFKLYDRTFKAPVKLQLKSECAARLSAEVNLEGDGFIISYDDIDCLPDEENYIEVTARLGNTRLKDRVPISK